MALAVIVIFMIFTAIRVGRSALIAARVTLGHLMVFILVLPMLGRNSPNSFRD